MIKVILTIIVFLTCLCSAIAEWDLTLIRTVPGKTNMKLLTVPFEGLNRQSVNPNDSNRRFLIFNGPIHRRFVGYEIYNKSILYQSTDSSDLRLASCFSEVVSTGKGVYGFGKYLIEFQNFNNTSKNISFIFNTLDSKAGMDNVLNGRPYHSDWTMQYYETDKSAYVIIDNGDSSSYRYIDTVFLGQTNREINYWYAYWREQAPLAKDFYVKTTPFPMNPYLVNDTNKLYNIKIGTKITFDTVYHNFGEQDRFGYNTVETNGPYDYYNDPPNIPDYDSLQKGNIFTTPAYYYFTNDPSGWTLGMKITAENSDTIILNKNKKLYINGFDYNSGGDTLFMKQGSTIIKEDSAKLNACFGGVIIDEGCNSVWSANSMQRIYEYSRLIYSGTSHLVNNGGKVQIDGYATLSLAANTTLVFDGSNTNLELKPNSIVQLGENAKIEFKNGAYLIADGSDISSAQGSHGRGIVLENAGEQTSITNCTFTNLRNSIFVKNTDSNYFGVFKNISNDTFYTDASCNYVIEAKNANNITVSNNYISMTPGKGVGILMRYYINQGNEESASPTYAVNVMGNVISNGIVSAAFISFTNSYPYINFKYNYCNGSVSNTNIAYRQTYGNIKYNFIANSSGKNLDLIQAHPDVLSNTFESYIMNVTINDSYPYLAPISTSSDGGWVWRGGKNTLTSTSNGNIYYNNGNALLDWGQNIFYKSYYNFHLQGRINEPSGVYYVRNNCFNGSNIPSTSLRDYYSDTTVVIPYYEGSNFSCNTSDAGTIWLIDDLGNGFYDTLYRTNDNSGYQPDEDEGLYSSAIIKKLNDDNYGAVSTFKTLINAHPQSSYTEACLYDLYECYHKLDTSANQTTHDILYSDLKYFLDSRIESGLYSDEFNLIAYNITVMCLASISEYYEAMSGYEFIALYHPDEYLSFLASWDYAEIEDLMNGSGGISSKEENMTQEEYYKKLKKRIDRKINDDPVKKMVKKSFDRTKAEKFSKIEKDAASRTNSNETAKQEIARMKSKYDDAKMKAVSIMRTSKSLTREEKDRKQIEDILLTKTEENKESATFSNIVPDEYSISQNYPNPFNPNTKINFALPKQGFVSLKIYDITGREIKTLVNEVKQAGYYTVDFNGSHLSSGVYFYRIKSGNFVSVKRMVLIK
ncbi:MAG: T9SS type A sorting domain-containing protein [Ignavibacteria bacterium]